MPEGEDGKSLPGIFTSWLFTTFESSPSHHVVSSPMAVLLTALATMSASTYATSTAPRGGLGFAGQASWSYVGATVLLVRSRR